MGERRVTRAEDAVISKIDAYFRLQRLLDVNFSNDSEALAFEGFNRTPHSLVKSDRQCLAEILAHEGLFPGRQQTDGQWPPD